MKKAEYIYWRMEFSVGVEEIDNQHKELLNFVNDSLNHCTGDREAEKKYFMKAIAVGLEYLKKHFSTEENIMTLTGYEKYKDHKTEHDLLIENLSSLIHDVEAGIQPLDLPKISFFLRDWFLNHIPMFDKPTEECFKKGYLSNSPDRRRQSRYQYSPPRSPANRS
ncbi:MAG: bacteriohemerythrin [Treponema sp.]|jgi:hemerythrin|nr:bacteriohemerythrin [Treponema sp.]